MCSYMGDRSKKVSNAYNIQAEIFRENNGRKQLAVKTKEMLSIIGPQSDLNMYYISPDATSVIR